MTDAILQQQIGYYRARASEYDEWFYRVGRYDRGPALNERWFSEINTVVTALDTFGHDATILELACGTGIWTERLAKQATHVTAIDASVEMIRLNRVRVRSAQVSYVQADLFEWQPARTYDAVFFGFWLSHVPPERFDDFWRLVWNSLRGGGRFFLVDSRRDATSTANDHRLPEPTTTTLERKLNDGREFRIYKIFYEPAALAARLKSLGWEARIQATPHYFIYGEGVKPA